MKPNRMIITEGENGRKNDDAKKILQKKPGVVFVVSRDMFFLFDCGGFKNASMTVRCRCVVLCSAVIYVGIVSWKGM